MICHELTNQSLLGILIPYKKYIVDVPAPLCDWFAQVIDAYQAEMNDDKVP
jgi:hypothetical protein